MTAGTATAAEQGWFEGLEVIEGIRYARLIAKHGLEIMDDENRMYLLALQERSKADLSNVISVQSEFLAEIDMDAHVHLIGVVGEDAHGEIAARAVFAIEVDEFVAHLHQELDPQELAANLLTHEVRKWSYDVEVTESADGTLAMRVISPEGEVWSQPSVAPDAYAIVCAVASYAGR